MPEGDSIHRLAIELGDRLVGSTLDRVIVRGIPRASLAGQRVAAVTAHGKHLVITTSAGTEIRSHLGMNGRWRRLAPSAPLATNADRVSLVLATARDTFVCRHAATVEVAERRAPGRGLALATLGPDLLDPAVAIDPTVIDRVAAQPASRRIAEVLLDQRVCAGIGNIWCNESLHLVGVDPRTPLGDVDPDDVIRAYQHARDLMRRRVDRTGPEPELAVYDRTGQPCRRCGSRITSYRVGERRAYSCPSCQPPPRR